MSASWLDWFKAFYPVVVTLFSMAGLGALAWLSTKYASKADLKKTQDDVAAHNTEITLLKDQMAASPTRQELHEDLADLAERMSGVEEGLKGIGKQLSTQNRMIETLIGKAIPQAAN